MSVFTAYLRSNSGEVSCFARKNLILCGFSSVVFLVKNSGDVTQLRLSCSARFFLLSKLYVSVGILSKLIEIYRLYGLDWISV